MMKDAPKLQRETTAATEQHNSSDIRPSAALIKTLLERLGFYSTHTSRRDAFEADFVRSCRSEVMSLEEFSIDFMNRGFSPEVTRAAFQSFDVDDGRYMTQDEYILCRAAFDIDYARDNGTEIMNYRLKVVFQLYDNNRDGYLEKTELEKFIADLACGKSHIQQMIQRLGINDGSRIPFNRFLEVFQAGHLSLFDLHTRDILETHTNSYCRENRVVLENRSVEATIKSPNTSHSSPPNMSVVKSEIIDGAALNTGCVVDSSITATSDWRGPLVPGRTSKEFRIAKTIINNTILLMKEHLNKTVDGSHTVADDLADGEWLANGIALGAMLGNEEDRVKQVEVLKFLAKACQRIVSQQPMMVEVPAPAKIFGDTHGQFRDLLLLFREFGFPSHNGGDVESISYVFNGDFVDRGAHQLEVVALLFSLKICYPSRVFLVRGNHEFKCVNAQTGLFGFQTACEKLYGASNGLDLYNEIHETFNYLPLSARINNSILVLHGGIGDGSYTLEDLKAIPRPLIDDLKDGLIANILWSDPSDSDAVMDSGVHFNYDRGDSTGLIKKFDQNITKGFCARENIQLIVRSHQLIPEGYRIMHSGRLITVFSARNYFNGNKNNGALLLVASDHENSLRVRPKCLKKRDAPVIRRPVSPPTSPPAGKKQKSGWW